MTLEELKRAEDLYRNRCIAKDAVKQLLETDIIPHYLSSYVSDRPIAYLPADLQMRDMIVDTLETYSLKMAGELADLGVFTHEVSSPDSENGSKDENNDPGR